MDKQPVPTAPRRWLLHVDMDQFIAAVEIRRRPDLVDLPVVVGGDGNPRRPRQVVATASYEARAFGVHSGMPMGLALRKCPQAVFLPSDHRAYDEASAEVWDAVRSFGYPVEVWGWDEGYLAAEFTDPVGPAELALRIQDVVFQRTALSCTVGIGDNKHQAKLAAGFGKPAGVATLTTAEWPVVMFPRPTTALSGIGSRTAKKLATLGISTVAELAHTDREVLAGAFGPTIGPWLHQLGNGGGDTRISTEPWVPKGKSTETTFETDLTDRVEIEAHVRRMAQSLTTEVGAEGRTVHRVAVKVRTSSFFTRTKISKLAAPTTDPATVAEMAATVLSRFELDRPIRLLGVRVELDVPAGAEGEAAG